LVEGTPGYEFARKNLDRADLVLTVSEQMKAIVENKFPFTKNKLDCFTWGIDVDFFKRGDRTKWRGELGLPLTGSFFIAPRGINDIYRPELIIQAFNLLKRTHKTIYLILLAGYASNERKKSIQNIIDKDPIQIIFIEDTVSQERMLGYYNSSDFYIGIPLYDQISAALLESMACGVIPIVSDIQSYKGLIVEDKNGFVFNGNDYESLSGLLNRAMNGKYNREMIRDNNINLVYDKFNWNDESKKMMAHYKRVIAQLY
jgi:glycosyltransferase involved in cell wall biosynthesis